VLYFLGAVGAHVRVKDTFKEFAPAALLGVISLVTVLLELHR